MKYHYVENKVAKGPVSIEELAEIGIKPDTLVWCKGMAKWAKASEVEALAGILAGKVAPPEPPTVSPASPSKASPASPQSVSPASPSPGQNAEQPAETKEDTVTCIECQQVFSSKLSACPNCGCPIVPFLNETKEDGQMEQEEELMEQQDESYYPLEEYEEDDSKRKWLYGAIGVLLALLIGCGLWLWHEQTSQPEETTEGSAVANLDGAHLLKGSIGQFHVEMMMMVGGEEVLGLYHYDTQKGGINLSLKGNVTGNGKVTVDEFTSSGKSTGRFEGTFDGHDFKGTFRNLSDGSQHSFALSTVSSLSQPLKLYATSVSADGYANIRKSPTASSDVVGVLYNTNGSAAVIGISGNWFKVNLNGVEGYVRKTSVLTGSKNEVASSIPKTHVDKDIPMPHNNVNYGNSHSTYYDYDEGDVYDYGNNYSSSYEAAVDKAADAASDAVDNYKGSSEERGTAKASSKEKMSW